MDLKDRLKVARRHAKMSQVQAAKAAGLDQATISNLERGRHHSSTRILQIADALGVSYRWLSEGKGEMLPQRRETDGQNSNIAPVEQPAQYHRYPVVSKVQAGKISECVVPYPAGAEEQHEATSYVAKGAAFWLEVSGDSMTAPMGVHPSVPEGTLVLVDTGIEAAPGKLVVAQLDDSNEATFKKLVEDGGQKYLQALNPAYPMIRINGNCRIVGVAVEAKTKL